MSKYRTACAIGKGVSRDRPGIDTLVERTSLLKRRCLHTLKGTRRTQSTRVAAPATIQAKLAASIFPPVKYKQISFVKPIPTGASAAAMVPKGKAMAAQAMPAKKWIAFAFVNIAELSAPTYRQCSGNLTKITYFYLKGWRQTTGHAPP